MATWKRLPQEGDGSYYFSGQLIVTAGVDAETPKVEIIAIHQDVQAFAKANAGAGYFQVYQDGDGRKLYLIDHLTKETVDSGDYDPASHHCTLLFSHEW